MNIYEDFKDGFKNPQEIFKEKNINKFDFLSFETFYEYYDVCGAAEYNNKLKYKYIFNKTKGDKYVFKTLYNNFYDCNGEVFQSIQTEIRNCEKLIIMIIISLIKNYIY